MTSLTWLSTLIVLLAVAMPAYGIVDLKRKPFNKIDEFLGLRDRLAKAGDKGSWIPFVKSERENIQNDIDAYLDDALRVLLDDSVVQIKNDIKKLQDKNKETILKISNYEIEKTSAPNDAKAYQFWKTTTGDLDDKIAAARRDIERTSRQIKDLMGEIRTKLAEAGIVLTDDQINNIFITISGEDQLYSIVVMKNLYSLTDILKDLMKSSKDLSVSKKYYGIFLLATEAHQRQLRTNLERIDNVYLPKLEALRRENSALMAKTTELAASNVQYRNNLAAQRITEEVAVKFRSLLGSQRAILETRLRAIAEIIQYTDNTYQTVSLASNLSDSMDECVNNLGALLKMPIVPPLPFDNQLEFKFLELSERLAED